MYANSTQVCSLRCYVIMLLDISLIGWYSAYNISDSSALMAYFVLLASCGAVTLQDVVCSAAVVKNTRMFRHSIWSVLNCCMPPLPISLQISALARTCLKCYVCSSRSSCPSLSCLRFCPECLVLHFQSAHCERAYSYSWARDYFTAVRAGVVHRAVYNNLFVFFVASQWSVELERLSTIFSEYVIPVRIEMVGLYEHQLQYWHNDNL